MSEVLRAKLRAQRAEKEQLLLHEQATHEAAKQAARQLVAVGMQFDQISENSGVSVPYLDDIFHSLGLEKAPKPVLSKQDIKKQEELVFGKPRWLEKESNYKFSLESDSSYSTESEDDTPPLDELNELTELKDETNLETNLEPNLEPMESEGTPPYSLDAIDDPVSNVVVDLTLNSEESSDREPELIDLTVIHEDDNAEVNADNEDDEGDVNGDDDAMDDNEDHIDDNDDAMEDNDDAMDDNDDAMDDNAQPDSPKDLDIHPTADEVKLRIQELKKQIEDRENAMKAPKVGKALLNKANIDKSRVDKRTSELLSIATKRAALMTSKSRLKVVERSTKIAQLEEMLKREKESQLQATRDALAIDQQFVELEKQALLLRAPVNDNTNDNTSDNTNTNTNTNTILNDTNATNATNAVDSDTIDAIDADADAEFQPVEVPAASNNPLCQFPSFRLCPRLDASEMFDERFNAAFVPDLQNRTFCDKEFNGRECKDKACIRVHFNEFIVPKPVILQYMASRFINKPGFRQHLIEQMRLRFQSSTVVPSTEVAKAIAEISHSFDASIFDTKEANTEPEQ